MSETFTIETNRLVLRDFIPDDWELMHVYTSEADFSKYEPWGPNTVTDTQKYVGEMVAQAQSSPRFKFDLAVCLRSSGLLIGGCGLRRETEHSLIANLGWSIDPAHQGQGFATEAARALIEYGFGSVSLRVIYATCDARNVASWRVMEKLGMTRVGLIVGDKVVKGHLRDTLRYEILPEN